jgi:hypothetical protein
MRLLNARTIELDEFFRESTPQYVTLSHRWGDEEVTFDDMKPLARVAAEKKPWVRENQECMCADAGSSTYGSTRAASTRIVVQNCKRRSTRCSTGTKNPSSGTPFSLMSRLLTISTTMTRSFPGVSGSRVAGLCRNYWHLKTSRFLFCVEISRHEEYVFDTNIGNHVD